MTTRSKDRYRSRSSERVGLAFVCQGPTMTKQSFQDACDINKILSQYRKTGTLAHVREQGRFEALPDASDYHEAMNLVVASQQAFAAMPAALRARFSNEPSRLLAFLEDPANRAEAEKLGLVKPSVASPVVDGAEAPSKDVSSAPKADVPKP